MRKAKALQATQNLLHASTIELIASGNELMVIKGCRRCRQRQVVAVERLPDAIHQIGHFGRSQRIANTQPREAIDFRESPRNHEVRELRQPRRRIGTLFKRNVLVISLVENHHHIGRNRLQKSLELRIREEGSGRVIRIGNPDQARIRAYRLPHGLQVMAKILGRHGDQFGACRKRSDRINSKSMLRKNRRATRRQKNASNHIQHIVGAITEHDALHAEAGMIGQRALQTEVIRVTLQRTKRFFQRHLRLRAHAQRVFVGRELDDTLYRKPHFTGELSNRLARQVRRDGADVRKRLIEKCHKNSKQNTAENKNSARKRRAPRLQSS